MIEKNTLIEFPTDFIIKVFGPNEQQFIDEIHRLAHANSGKNSPAKLTHQFSKNKRYVSISIKVYVTSKPNLDKIYQALTTHPLVKMVI